MRHDHVALRFLPQTSIRNFERLYTWPKPSLATRIFMIFQGVQVDPSSNVWEQAERRAKVGGAVWKAVVGVSQPAPLPSRPRMMEVGGMEVR